MLKNHITTKGCVLMRVNLQELIYEQFKMFRDESSQVMEKSKGKEYSMM